MKMHVGVSRLLVHLTANCIAKLVHSSLVNLRNSPMK